MPLFVVETIRTFRHKYVIECNSVDHAMDTVAMEEAIEFSQMCLGEQIVTGREITYSNYAEMIAALNNGYGDGMAYQPESGSPWMGEKLITRVNYDVSEVSAT